MEHLVEHLKQILIQRKLHEMRLIEQLSVEADHNLILVSSGKIFELDFLIHSLDELLAYSRKTT